MDAYEFQELVKNRAEAGPRNDDTLRVIALQDTMDLIEERQKNGSKSN